MNFKTIATAFIALTVIFGASTGYLLTTRSASTSTTTFTTTISGSISTVTGAASSSPSVGIAYKSGLGFFLVNGSGMTLYYRITDIRSNGTSTCTGGCVLNWPVFYTNNLTLPAGLNTTSFKAVTRADGKQQLTYDGWPLYFFSGDHKPGDVNGQGIDGIWFALSLPAPMPSTVSTSTTTTSSDTSSSTSSTTTTTTSTSTSYTYPY